MTPAIARRLFLPDTPAGTVGQVLTVQSDGMITWADPPGGSGTPGACTLVDSLNATPRAVTDWGPILQTAINNGTRCLAFGPYDYPLLTGITVAGITGGVKFQGVFTGFAGYTPYAAGASRIIWNGTGTGHLFSETDSLYAGQPGGVSFRDLAFIYTQSGYTGTLFWPQWNFHWEFDHCFFSSPWTTATSFGSLRTATAAIQTDSVNTLVVRNCVFDNSFAKGALYRATPNTGFANVIRVSDTTFGSTAFTNPNNDNLFDHCIFETLTEYMFQSDQASQIVEIAIRDCSLWDAAAPTGGLIGNCFGNEWHIIVDGLMDHGNPGQLLAWADLSNAKAFSTLSVISSQINDDVIFPNTGTGGAQFAAISFTDCSFDSTSNRLKNLVSQGNVVSTKGCVSGSNTGAMSELGSWSCNIGHEQINNLGAGFTQFGPTFTAVAASHTIFGSGGNDTAGWVQIRNGGAGVGATGVLADVTFLNAYHTNNGAQGAPLVQLFPWANTDNSTWYAAAALFYSCQVVGIGVPGAQKFRIVINGTGIPAAATISVGYRVIYLFSAVPTFYIPLAQAFVPGATGEIKSGVFSDIATGVPIAIPQADAPNILQRWTLFSIYAPFAIVMVAGTPASFQLGVSALINETPVWAQQVNGQLSGTSTSQVLAGDLFNPLELNAGQKLTFAWQLSFAAGPLTQALLYLGGSYGSNGIQPVPGVVNYAVAYDPALPGRGR